MSSATRRQRRQRRKTYRGLKREARHYERLLVDKAARLGVEFWARDRDAKGVVRARHRQRLKFLQCRFNLEAIYWQIDMQRLPHGVSTKTLADPAFGYDLSLTVRRRVQFKRDIQKGTWLILWRDESRAGVPNYVKYKSVLDLIPKQAPPLTFVVGVAENRRLELRDLAKLPHLLIGGSTDTGKSVFLNQIICTFAMRTTPHDLRFYMIDLKGGVELSFYDSLPHLAADIMTRPKDVIPVLEEFHKEILRRGNMFKGVCRDIHGWNKQRPAQTLPLLVLVMDEIAEILLDKKVANPKGEAERLISRCAAMGRFTGCYLIGATQRPDSTIISGLIKQNFTARAAFACASPHDSRTIINNGDAYGLSPQGRFIWLNGIEYFQVQGPNITDATVKKVVRTVVGDKSNRTRHRDWRVILRYSRDNLGGDLSRAKLWAGLKQYEISEQDIRRLVSSVSGKTVGLDGYTGHQKIGRAHV